MSAGRFEGPLRAAILALKYHGRRAVAPSLGQLVAAAVAAPSVASDGSSEASGVLVPVPLHPQRQRERGFNQAALLAEAAGAVLGRPVDVRAIRRVRPTAPQVGLDVRARRANVRGAFEASRPLKGLRVLLVDDVCTTGATLEACAAACFAAGAKRVTGVTVAREV